MSLASDLRKIAKRRKEDLVTIQNRSLYQVSNSIILNSPVDEGTFRGNWNAGVDNADESTDSAADPMGMTTQGRLNAKLSTLKPGQSFYFTNSLPYGEVLEYGGYSYGPKTTSEGFSKKAPQGMVGISITLWDEIVAREVQKLL